MTIKTEGEIAREKEAVQKMIGAKSAMETTLMRVKRLEDTIGQMVILIDDMKGAVGESTMFGTYHHGERDNSSGPKPVLVRKQMARIAQMGRDVK